VAYRLAGYFRRIHIDLVHAHQCTPWFYAALSRCLYRKPRLLLEEHGRFYPETESRLRRWVNRWIICRLTHRFVAVSRDIKERLVRYEGIRAAEIEVVYNGVRPTEVIAAEERQSLRRSFHFEDKDFVVGTVGRLDPIKNIPMLISSIEKVRSYIPNVRGLIVGDGEEYQAFEATIAEKGLGDCIQLAGFRADAAMLTQCMDLFVLASLSEGTSMALLEAMAAGVPVAVTAVGGNPEVVINGDSGWLMPSGDVDSLHNVIVEAVRSPDKASALAENGKRRFRETFMFDGMINRYRDIYGEMLESPIARQSIP
jgi:glycosyltransferase involved in cell wall biosynthesis